MRRLTVCALLVFAACTDDEGGPRDLNVAADLTGWDGALSTDFSIEEDLSPPPPDLRGIDGPPEPVVSVGAADRFLISGTMLTPGGPLTGELLVEGTLITCVAASCSGQPGAAGATVIRSQGLIIPGLIDAHNHGLYDIFDETDWAPTKLYNNHTQWTAEVRYKQMVDAKQYLDSETAGSTIDVNCEMDKWAEMKALASATTSILIAPTGAVRACYASLARTIDTPQNGLGIDVIQTAVSIPASDAATTTLCGNFASGKTNAYVVHVAEGVPGDATSLHEFSSAAMTTGLIDRSGGCLLSPHTTIVHGTALGTPEFTKMATAGMRLVWSPRSNMFLYGKTTQIDLAIAAGVQTIALAPDWSMGGSVDMLDEIAFAANYAKTNWPGLLSAERLFNMATIDAAKALGMDTLIGSLEVGKRADLALVGGDPGDPYNALIGMHTSAVQLVMVDGRVSFGDAALIAAGPATPGCETLSLCGASKFICAAESSTANQLDETYAQVVQALGNALTQYDAMTAPMGVAPFSPLAPLAKCP